MLTSLFLHRCITHQYTIILEERWCESIEDASMPCHNDKVPYNWKEEERVIARHNPEMPIAPMITWELHEDLLWITNHENSHDFLCWRLGALFLLCGLVKNNVWSTTSSFETEFGLLIQSVVHSTAFFKARWLVSNLIHSFLVNRGICTTCFKLTISYNGLLICKWPQWWNMN
jgi:hypothetical protein